MTDTLTAAEIQRVMDEADLLRTPEQINEALAKLSANLAGGGSGSAGDSG
tara:strand:+ start:2316 stop:2465 length:150 start_codon:yes stop_codon:yes gene_type:complete